MDFLHKSHPHPRNDHPPNTGTFDVPHHHASRYKHAFVRHYLHLRQPNEIMTTAIGTFSICVCCASLLPSHVPFHHFSLRMERDLYVAAVWLVFQPYVAFFQAELPGCVSTLYF